MYESETWTWNKAQQSRVRAVEMSYPRGACGVTRRECESNESVNERCGMGPCAKGVKCGVVEWVKRNALRWLGDLQEKMSEDFVKKLYVSETEGPKDPKMRGRPVVRWKYKV